MILFFFPPPFSLLSRVDRWRAYGKKVDRTDANSKATPISDLNNLSADKGIDNKAEKQERVQEVRATASKS